MKGEQKDGHVVLIGDSIFDNAAYVQANTEVIEQLNSVLPPHRKATLLAVDGATTGSISHQVTAIPNDTSHIIISVGGNDALLHKGLLDDKAESVAEVLAGLAEIQKSFREAYKAVLDQVTALRSSSAFRAWHRSSSKSPCPSS